MAPVSLLQIGLYDVFISHCGKDCKKDFAPMLKMYLETVGLRCFFDKSSLEVGDVATDKLLEALATTRCGIVILSPGFFQSQWCMKELQMFQERKQENCAFPLVPIFLGDFEEVDSARHAAVEGKVWMTFSEFVRSEGEYRKVAHAVKGVTGVRLAEEGGWDSCFKQVRDGVLKLLGKDRGGHHLTEEGLLVGQFEHLANLRRLLGVPEGTYATDGALFELITGEVGIVGPGGIGKTALAKRLYDDPSVREWFDGGLCWLEVHQSPSDDRISGLQKQILKKLCGIVEDVGNPTDGRASIRQKLQGKRVLICLDNIWEDDDKATPIVKVDSLSPGSRILKTSRNREAIVGEVYDLAVLSRDGAWELFRWHAFKGAMPPDNVIPRAEEAVEKCGGMPLAIRIFGTQLAGAGEAKLKESLEKFVEYSSSSDALLACQDAVQNSYDNLPVQPPRLKDAFLLVAGIWPHNFTSREQGRLVQNLSTAVYGHLPDPVERQLFARKALATLRRLSLVSLKVFGQESDSTDWLIEGLNAISVHDVVAEFARGESCGRIKQPVVSAGRGIVRYINGEVSVSLDAGGHAYVRSLAALEQLVRVTPSSELLSLVMEVESGVEGRQSALSAIIGLEPAPRCRLLIYRVSQEGSSASAHQPQQLLEVEHSEEVGQPLVSMINVGLHSAVLGSHMCIALAFLSIAGHTKYIFINLSLTC